MTTTLTVAKVEVMPSTPPVLSITLSNGETSTLPMHPPVVALMNAGAWLMREYIARKFEEDLGGPNLVSRRVRSLNAGEADPTPRKQGASAATAGQP